MTQLELSTFLAIAKYGSISETADRLYTSQPALSRRLKSLESELGYPLFRRSQGKKNLSLTNQGTEFLSIAENLLSSWNSAINLKNKNFCPNYTVILNSSMGCHVPLALGEFIASNSDINFKYHVYHSLEAYQWMEYGKADFALVSKTVAHSTVHAVPAYREKMIFLARNMFFKDNIITVHQLDVSSELMIPWFPDFHDWHDYWFGATANPKVYGDNASVMNYFWSNESSWWTIVPASFAQTLLKLDGVRSIPLLEAPDDLIIYYLSKTGGNNALNDSFLSCLVKHACTVSGIISCI